MSPIELAAGFKRSATSQSKPKKVEIPDGFADLLASSAGFSDWNDLMGEAQQIVDDYNGAKQAEPTPVGEVPHKIVYDVQAIMDDGSFLTKEYLEDVLSTLISKKNLILQGPPGTGKTWLAKRLGWALAGGKNSPQVEVMQFHPSMSYEDFVRGMRPSGQGKLELVDGPFLEFCERARHDPESAFVMVIEEINRGNPAQIFGELLTLLEATKRSRESAMRLTYTRKDNNGETEEPFFIPENVHLIGTMNIADRSLSFVDMALRRRFAFVELEPELNERWLQYCVDLGYNRDVLSRIQSRVLNLNLTIQDDRNLGKQFRIGHSYFVPTEEMETDDGSWPKTEAWYKNVVNTEIATLLREYWFDDADKAETQINRLLED